MPPPFRPRRSPRALLRPLTAVVGAAALAVAGLLPLAGPAAAKEAVPSLSGDSYLCTGYAGCENAGYSNHGYRERGGSMYWRMYSGHNCTNYAAYRMIQAGMPTSRPWEGSGNATNWGYAMSSITDETPAVGAVAWWRANAPGAGSAGHVAYVERVVSKTEIVVSEDSWGGDFHWRRITTSGSWPSGFIHFTDARGARDALRSTAAPVISGRARVGESLVATKGTWNATPERGRRQWMLDGTPVRGATSRTFTLRPRMRGRTVSVRVTARRDGWTSGTALSGATSPVTRGRFSTTAPVVEGTAQVGERLTAVPAAATPSPARTALQWYADGDPVAGETGATLEVREALRGSRLRAGVVSTRRGYRPARRLSPPTAPVQAPQIEVTRPAVLEGAAVVGETLSAVPGGFAPRRASARYTWLRDGRPVATPRTATYQLRPRDAGHRVAVRVDLVRSGWRRTSQVVALTRRVRTPGSLSVETTGRPRQAIVSATLTAPGVRGPSGPGWVRVGAHTVRARFVDGTARVVVRDLRPGTRPVTVRFRTSSLVLGVSAEASVRVPRRTGAGAREAAPAAPEQAPSPAPVTPEPAAAEAPAARDGAATRDGETESTQATEGARQGATPAPAVE